jgi:NADPH:quinone reductase-like Zn-dependent oxidoreductase
VEEAVKALVLSARDIEPAVQEITQPGPSEGEVLVAVETASVNGFDLGLAAGHLWDMLPHEFPVVLGRDLGKVLITR